MSTHIRYGELSFINALPLVLAKDCVPGAELHFTRGVPTTLNQAMLQGLLDVSAVSSAFYLRHPEQFVLLSDVSISATQAVESVLLFMPQGKNMLYQVPIISVPDTSETSIALMEYVYATITGLKQPYQMEQYVSGQGKSCILRGQPTLAIGDEALALKEEFGLDIEVIDLAQAWQNLYDLPFVFAVWVAQKEWAQNHPQQLNALNQAIVSQKRAFQTEANIQQSVIQLATIQNPKLSPPHLTRYLTMSLSYDLTPTHQHALQSFSDVLQWLDDESRTSSRPPLPLQFLHRSI